MITSVLLKKCGSGYIRMHFKSPVLVRLVCWSEVSWVK